ncbi:MAG: extracellular solute-binding protein [Oscillospiraceae bacterium]|nr:extracellular solute-binding protein [Oscillospiraceae bacterium]
MKRILSLLLAAALFLSFTGCGLLIPKETEPPTEPTEAEIPLEAVADERPCLGQELKVSSVLEESNPVSKILMQAGSVFEAKTGCSVNFTWQAFDLEAGEKIPYNPSLTGVYYNLDVFENCGITALPETWEEFLQLCEALKNAGYQPLSINSEDAALAFEVLLLPILGSLNSVEIWEENEQAVAALQKMADLAAAGYLIMADAPVGQDKLARSNAAMTIGNLDSCEQIEERNLMDISWGVIPMFGGFANLDALAVQGSAEAVAAFAELLIEGEFDQLRADVTGGIPADSANSDVLPGGMEAMKKAVGSRFVDNEKLQTVCLELWNGKFPEAVRFAAALDDLAKN